MQKLSAIEDPEQFLWRILPHAARTFSFVIVFLPPRMRRALAIAYLYCRMLDTYEDLLPATAQKESALKRFISRFDNPGNLKPAPDLDPALAADPQERSHVLLVNRSAFVDYHFGLLASSQQAAICRLVRRMGEGMIWASRVFGKQDGTLQTPGQLSRY
ncbi:MAG: squalene/phytoene synthase family protein, partial [Desulfobacterales bacterium]